VPDAVDADTAVAVGNVVAMGIAGVRVGALADRQLTSVSDNAPTSKRSENRLCIVTSSIRVDLL
jgi:hypothetical protein